MHNESSDLSVKNSRLLMILFMAMLIGAPLAFGTTELWSFILLQLLCLSTFVLLLRQSWREREGLLKIPGRTFLLLLGGYFALQLIPLPPALLQRISPATWGLYQETVWVLSPDVWMPLSVNPKLTCLEWARFWTYGVFYLVAVQLLSARERMKRVLYFLSMFAGGFALLGIMQYLLPSARLFWFLRAWPERTCHHFATYVNGNHYAGLMEMLLPVILCLFLATRPQIRYGSWRERLIETLGNPRGHRHVLYGGSALLVAASIFLSLSRGGILSTLTALLLLSLFLLLWGKERKAGIWLLALMLGMLLTVGVVGWQPILERFEHMRTDTGALADERPSYWRDSSELLRRFPLAGSGFGTFIDVYPGVKTAKTPFTVDHAHNDYLELATDSGLIGLLLVAGFLLTVLGRVVPAWRRRRSPFSIMVVLGALTGLVAIGLHSVTDFNLHIGANALFLVWLLALAVAAAHGRSRGTVVSELPRASCRSSCIAGALLAFGLLLALLFNLGVLLAQRSFLPLEQVDLATVKSLSEREDLRAAAASAARFDPLERRYRYALANVDFSLGYVSRGLTEFSQVLRLGPLQGEYLERIGSVYAHLQRPLLARRLLGAAVATDISEPRRALALAELLLARNETEEAFRIIRQALAFAPERTRDFLLLLILHRVPDEAMVLAFPERARVYEKYGDYLLERDDVEGAEAAFAQALYLFEQEENPSLQVIWRLRAYFFGRKAYQSALQVVQAGLKRQPENAALRRAAGELYERLGIPYRALEEYRHVLVIEPEDEEARERLEVLGGKNQ